MRDKASRVISYVFHPLIMPSLTFGILYVFVPQVLQPLSILTLPFLFFTTYVVPLASIAMLKTLGSIRSFRLESREERVMPFSFVTIFYGMTAYMFIFKIHVNQTVAVIFISTCVLLVLLTLVTVWFKISIHAAGVAGVSGYLLALSIDYAENGVYYPTLAMLVLAGMVMSARLQLNAHTPNQVLLGALSGTAISFSAIYFFG